MKRRPIERGHDLCLGLVLVAKPGCLASLASELSSFPGLDTGEPNKHQIPACALVCSGDDEALLAELEALPSMLKAEVVYAQRIGVN